MNRKRKTLLMAAPVLVMVLALMMSSVGMAGPFKPGRDNGRGVVYSIYSDSSGAVYQAIYHENHGRPTVIGTIYPDSGQLQFCPKCGRLLGRGVIHRVWIAPSGAVYRSVDHWNAGAPPVIGTIYPTVTDRIYPTVTDTIYPPSGTWHTCPSCGHTFQTSPAR